MKRTKDARRVLEHVRWHLRDMKHHSMEKDIPTKMGALADYISECLDALDDDVFMRCSLSADNEFEIRIADKRSLKFEDIDMIGEMLRFTQDSLERRKKGAGVPGGEVDEQ